MVRVGLHQAEPGSGIHPGEMDRYRAAGIEILVLPEYFWVRPGDKSHTDTLAHTAEDLETMARMSEDEGWLVVGGTVVENHPHQGWHNACPVFHGGVEIGRYRKIHLMPGERKAGAVPGEDFVMLGALDLRIAPIICADVMHADTFVRVADLEPDLILAPMASPLRKEDTEAEKLRRDREFFEEGAAKTGAAIVKVAGVGSVYGRPLQGRCLVVTPEDLIFRTPFSEERERRTWVVEVPVGPVDAE